MCLDMIAKLLAALSPFMWPTVVVFLVLYFSKAIKERLRNVREVDWKNRVMRFGEAKSDSQGDLKTLEAATVSLPIAANAVKWANTGNLYWLGNDLTWTAQVMLRAAPKQKVLRGLKQSQYHISHLGLTDFLARINALSKEAEDVPDHAMTTEWRNGFSGRLSQLSYEIGSLAGKNQPDFEKDVPKN